MKKSTFIFMLFAVLFLGIAGEGRTEIPPGTICPVMPGHRASGKFYVDYQGKRVYLCCRSCVKAFRKHPERYFAKAA